MGFSKFIEFMQRVFLFSWGGGMAASLSTPNRPISMQKTRTRTFTNQRRERRCLHATMVGTLLPRGFIDSRPTSVSGGILPVVEQGTRTHTFFPQTTGPDFKTLTLRATLSSAHFDAISTTSKSPHGTRKQKETHDEMKRSDSLRS